MNILITNDDGINSIGLKTLAEEISKIANIAVAAPDRERSAISHAITMHKPLRADKVIIPDTGISGWKINGTPADCVKLALEALLDFTPDFVLSGINSGPNLATDVIYSGTVSAASEAAMSGIPAIALSIAGHGVDDFCFISAASIASKLLLQIINQDLPENMLLNINIPPADPNIIKGIAITRLGNIRYINSFDRRIDPRGKAYFWLSGQPVDYMNDKGSDVWAVKNNYVSVTPLHVDLTKYEAIDTIESWNLEITDENGVGKDNEQNE